MQNFEDYKSECVNDIASLQPEFIQAYDINSYEEWYYDNVLGVFHFKSIDGRSLYFKHVDVGSFSTNTDTWRWAWDNETTPKHVSKSLEKVKAFGLANNYAPLTEGLIQGDEYTGWEMASISAKLLDAIGVYRAPHDHLFSYFIFINELTSEEYEELKHKYIRCEIHQADRIAFVCQHLLNNTHQGFHEAFDSDPLVEQEDDHQAWCDACEKVRLKEDKWTDEAMAFADIQVVCNQCYFNIKERNT